MVGNSSFEITPWGIMSGCFLDIMEICVSMCTFLEKMDVRELMLHLPRKIMKLPPPVVKGHEVDQEKPLMVSFPFMSLTLAKSF